MMGVYNISGLRVDNNWFWENKSNVPYWVLHLDCGRKYFSVSNVKSIIDAMSSAGMNQLQVHFSEDEGFRFALDDMTISANGTTYDLTPCLGGSENSSKWYSETDMDEIITYAHSKGIDIVPSFDMPGHMGRILSTFTAFKLNNTNTLDIKSETAVNFAKALVAKYANYFADKGCHWYNVGYDELMGWAVGFPQFYNNGDFDYVVNFANDIAQVVKRYGMIPRAFNEPFHYNNDPYYFINRDYEVMYWDGSIQNETLSTAQKLLDLGYVVINSGQTYYWVINSQRQVTAETLRTANYFKDFDTTSTTKDGNGAMFCVWCDNAQSSSDSGDDGTAVVNAITPLIVAYGEGIANTLASLSD